MLHLAPASCVCLLIRSCSWSSLARDAWFISWSHRLDKLLLTRPPPKQQIQEVLGGNLLFSALQANYARLLPPHSATPLSRAPQLSSAGWSIRIRIRIRFSLPADLWRQLKVSHFFPCSGRALEVFKCFADLQGGSYHENW